MAKRYVLQLMDHVTRGLVQGAGGVCMVVVQGGFDQVALTDRDGASVANPTVLTQGQIEFYTADSVLQVDLYGMAPGGEAFSLLALDPSGPNEIFIDTNQAMGVLRIPFSDTDSTDAVEQDTGFDIPINMQILSAGMGIYVNDVDATEGMDVGILSGESGGDANGFMEVILVDTAGFVAAEIGFQVGANATFMDLTGGDNEFTLGALMCAALSRVAVSEGSNVDTDEGFYLTVPFIGDGTAESVSYTTTTGSDTGNGLILLPYMKAPAVA